MRFFFYWFGGVFEPEVTSFPSDSRFCGGIIVCQVGQRKRTYIFFFHKVVRMSRVGPRPCSPWFRQLLSDKAFSVKSWSLYCVVRCFLKVRSPSSLLCMQKHDLLAPWAFSAFMFLILLRDRAHCCLEPCVT